MNPASQEKPPWWSYAGGWETEGIKTPMRRCGVCKCDLSELERERGLCRRHATESDDRARRERLQHERARREDQENAALRPQPAAGNALLEPEPFEDDDCVDDDDFERVRRSIRDGMR